MEDFAEIPVEFGEESVVNTDVKFDPSDYLPRRTSRASAHAASKAIKKWVKEEKTDPSKVSASSRTAKGRDSEHEPSHFGKVDSAMKTICKGQPPYDCRIKLVRCDEDSSAKNLIGNTCKKKVSSYKVVYAPVAVPDNKVFVTQSNGTLQPVTKENTLKCQKNKQSTDPLSRYSKYLSGDRQPQPSIKPSSLNVVVVHPKPGSKIINASQGRKSKSNRLNEMLSDPSIVISSEVSRIMTTGGNAELLCDKCSKTYRVARDLINHKKMAHKASQHMCTLCAMEFSSVEGLDQHKCKAKFRCDICGIFCKSPGMVMNHKSKAHPKTLGSYMCGVCCFNASSQEQLDAHVCGGKPKIKYSARASPAVMVFPTWDQKLKASTSSTPSPNIYVNIPLSEVPSSSSSSSGGRGDGDQKTGSAETNAMQFLCEVCLNMFPDGATLASHKCDTTVVMVDNEDHNSSSSQPAVSAPPRGVLPLPMPSMVSPVLPLEVMPEVEQLARFYSSVVFME